MSIDTLQTDVDGKGGVVQRLRQFCMIKGIQRQVGVLRKIMREKRQAKPV